MEDSKRYYRLGLFVLVTILIVVRATITSDPELTKEMSTT